MIRIITLAIISLGLSAKDCSYSFSSEDIEAHWIAFKTPSKLGVKGRFRELGLSKKEYKGKNLISILDGLTYNINTRSVWTRNSARDAKIVKYFFTGHKNGYKISGKIKDIDDEDLLLEVTMNGVTKDVPMKVKMSNKSFLATGTMDVLDFTLHSSLKAINKACDSLHKGKTWNDVDLELKVNFEKECK